MIKTLCYLTIGLIIHWVTFKIATHYYNKFGIGKDVFIAYPGQAGSDVISGRTIDNFFMAYALALTTEIIVAILLVCFFLMLKYIKQIIRYLI
jgi:hypothetical protein